jgi:hypothetical protein
MAIFFLTVFAALYLFAFLVFLGYRTPGYSHVRHTISELGEIGAPYARLVAVGVFAPVGASVLLAAYLTRSTAPDPALLALCISVGYLVAAMFPCDPGSPVSGSSRQAIHNLGGAVEYIGGAFALVRIAKHVGQPFEAAGLIVFGAAIAISLAPLSAVRGLIQRVAEVCLFGGLALALWLGRAAHNSFV